jgi:hypothetical protein
MLPPLELTKQAIREIKWEEGRNHDFIQTHHSDIQEMREIVSKIQDCCSSSLNKERVVVLVDSRVCVGAAATGRSSSRQVNRQLKRLSAACLVGRKELACV